MTNLVQETLKGLDESIGQLNKKKDLSPADLEIMCKAYKLKMDIEDFYMNDGGEYSQRGSYRSYDNDNSYYRMAMDPSYAPARSPVTGRYVSRGGNGMSSHSIKDRMVSRLEAMYDEAQSEHEREEIRSEIRRIEAER